MASQQAGGAAAAAAASAGIPEQHQADEPELDDFGLPIRPKLRRQATVSSDEFQSADEGDGGESDGTTRNGKDKEEERLENGGVSAIAASPPVEAVRSPSSETHGARTMASVAPAAEKVQEKDAGIGPISTKAEMNVEQVDVRTGKPAEIGGRVDQSRDQAGDKAEEETAHGDAERPVTPTMTRKDRSNSKGSFGSPVSNRTGSPVANRKSRSGSSAAVDQGKEVGGISEWSHQVLAPPQEEEPEVKEELTWQEMPTDSQMDYYDDFGHLVAKADKEWDERDYNPTNGGAGKGYTRVQLDEDAQSATSMDDHTAYLFKNKGGGTTMVDEDEDEDTRDPMAQMQATKDLLTEGQRIAYVGVARLSMEEMRKEMNRVQVTKKFKKDFHNATESLKMWSQKMMVRLYAHMDISSSEQIMIEQLAEHGIQPADMTAALMQNARVKNPLAESEKRPRRATKSGESPTSPRPSHDKGSLAGDEESVAEPPPPYTAEEKAHVPEAVDPSTLEKNDSLDIDLRWTVLCDLFLVLIADSIYDARSRVLLETVGEALEIPWLDICRFEKRVTDALEMQEEAAKEDWDEADTMEVRRKMALKRKYLMMGLATAGGGLLIGLSAGLLAPVIGAGLAAGFSAIGVAGTSGFMAGAGGAAIITASSAIAGGTIAVKASSRRMGAVRTFEYRPLHNNKRVNLIVTISGWMNGKVDDVRLPFSTVDPIMGDIYSLYWEPEMLQSMGDTIRIIATEALTQGLQQVLAATFLSAVLAGLSAPIILSKLSYLIDNPWSSSLDRAERAGLILADSIIDRHLGVRPITLVGFSLGSRVIFSCLKELSNRGAYGLVQNVYIFGSPVIANKEEWLRVRTVTSGRLVNGYASNDWILGYLFRATSGGVSRVAGLAPVEDVPGVENLACTDMVNGHMAYRTAMPKLLRAAGWEVEHDEFSEIEDPDPENHESRQRELIQEIEHARQAAQEQPEKRRWWSNKKKQQKKGWEMYDNTSKTTGPGARKSVGGGAGGAGGGDDKDDLTNVLFDIDAIRRELESEHMEVRQLESTLPPMQVSLDKPRDPEPVPPIAAAAAAVPGKAAVGGGSLNPFAALRSNKSYNNASDPNLSKPRSGASGRALSPNPDPSPARKSTSNMYDYDEDEDADPVFNGGGADGITMSFEAAPGPHDDDDDDDLGWRSSSRSMTTTTTTTTTAAVADRPPLKSSHTMPTGFGSDASHGAIGGLNLEHNAWADEDAGEEGEITMQFA